MNQDFKYKLEILLKSLFDNEAFKEDLDLHIYYEDGTYHFDYRTSRVKELEETLEDLEDNNDDLQLAIDCLVDENDKLTTQIGMLQDELDKIRGN